MNQPQHLQHQANYLPDANTEVTLIDLVIAFTKRKKLMLALPLLFAVCGALVTLAMPDTYLASTKILPKEQSRTNAATMLNHLGALTGGGSALSIQIPVDPNIRIPIELYLSMLKSRSVADSLTQRFDLKTSYGAATLDRTRKFLEQNTTIKSGKDGLITIEVEDEDPKRAAQIANAYVDELLKLTKTMGLAESSQLRLFFERQVRSAEEKLEEAQASLKGVSSGVNINNQTRITAGNVAQLRAQVSAKEIELSAIQAFATVNSQDQNRVQKELDSMRVRLARFGSSGSVEQLEKAGDFDKIKSYYDVKYYETIYKALAKQYESARINEVQDTSLIQVLDKAIEPEQRHKPKRALIALLFTLFGLFVAICWVLLFDVVGIGRNRHLKPKY